MPRKKTVWGTPGQTGVTDDGVPWYVPDEPPGLMERMLYKAFPNDGSYIPAGARFVPARTAQEVRERCLRKYSATVASYLRDDEDIDGFIGFTINDQVPQPPRGPVEAKVGPNPLKHWWMGGGWDTLAGKLLITIGSSRETGAMMESSVSARQQLWVRTSRRVVIMAGSMVNPMFEHASYGLDQVGISPEWKPDTPGERERVDIAFADGSWLGLERHGVDVPGPTEDFTERDLLAELAGPPVVSTVLPPIRS